LSPICDDTQEVGRRRAAYHLAMRRPRPHRLTGSVRRLLAAAALGILGAAFAVTSAARPASAAGLGVNLNLGVAGLNVTVPGLPTFFPTPTPPPPTTSLPGAKVPVLCPPTCTATPGGTKTGNTGSTTPATTHTGGSPRAGSRSPGGASVPFGSVPGSGSSATSALSAPQSVGLAVSPPPPVEQLTPLAGISFGQAPYLWPLFILLDVVAAGAVVFLVRRTWSPASDSD
jgi:hypothetical protein